MVRFLSVTLAAPVTCITRVRTATLSIELLTTSSHTFATKCVDGIEANRERAQELLEKNAIVITALNPYIGYDNGAKIAKEAVATGRSVRELVLEAGLLTEEELDKALDLKKMTEGGIV